MEDAEEGLVLLFLLFSFLDRCDCSIRYIAKMRSVARHGKPDSQAVVPSFFFFVVTA